MSVRAHTSTHMPHRRGPHYDSAHHITPLPRAAHCLYDRDTRKWVSSSTFFPGQYRSGLNAEIFNYPYGLARSSYYQWLTGWVTEPNANFAFWYDIATVVVYTQHLRTSRCVYAGTRS